VLLFVIVIMVGKEGINGDVGDAFCVVVVLGGGRSIWQGATVYRSTELFDGHTETWRSGPNMMDARCGLSAATNPRWVGDLVGFKMWSMRKTTTLLLLIIIMVAVVLLFHHSGSIFVAGGYAGGANYLSSFEYLPSDGRGWIRLPPMQYPRTGFGLCLGPDHCLYAVGGSPNGADSHNSAERYDERRGVWEILPPMVAARGYW